jgi:hypothetical protein
MGDRPGARTAAQITFRVVLPLAGGTSASAQLPPV